MKKKHSVKLFRLGNVEKKGKIISGEIFSTSAFGYLTLAENTSRTPYGFLKTLTLNKVLQVLQLRWYLKCGKQ